MLGKISIFVSKPQFGLKKFFWRESVIYIAKSAISIVKLSIFVLKSTEIGRLYVKLSIFDRKSTSLAMKWPFLISKWLFFLEKSPENSLKASFQKKIIILCRNNIVTNWVIFNISKLPEMIENFQIVMSNMRSILLKIVN